MGIPHTRSVLRLDSLTQEKGTLMCQLANYYAGVAQEAEAIGDYKRASQIEDRIEAHYECGPNGNGCECSYREDFHLLCVSLSML